MKTCYVDITTRAILDLSEMVVADGVEYEINRINVPADHRRRGLASELLDRMLEDADDENVTIRLHISPSGGLSYSALRAWYERRGFRRRIDGYFVRVPKG